MTGSHMVHNSFQFLGIPPKGELSKSLREASEVVFPISRDPPEGGTGNPKELEKGSLGRVSNF